MLAAAGVTADGLVLHIHSSAAQLFIIIMQAAAVLAAAGVPVDGLVLQQLGSAAQLFIKKS